MKVKLEDIYPSHIDWEGYNCYRKTGTTYNFRTGKTVPETGYQGPYLYDECPETGKLTPRFKRSDKMGQRFNNYVRGLRRLLAHYLTDTHGHTEIRDIQQGFDEHLRTYHQGPHQSNPCDKYDFGPWNTPDETDYGITQGEIEAIGADKEW